MVFRKASNDPRNQKRGNNPHEIPYKLASYEHDYEGKKLRSTKVVYSFWSASKYVLILSLMLWWLPMFGQMIAGYVGGRRAGGPWRGVMASIIPVVCLYAVVTGFDNGYLPSHVFGIAVAPAAIGASLEMNVPIISPYIQFSSEYVGSFVNALAGASPYGINTYVLTVAFAYVGGVLAAQNRREMEYTSGAVTSNTTVLVADERMHGMFGPQYQEEPHGSGVLAGLGSMLHIQRGDDQAVRGSGLFHRRRDDWARAVSMHYEDPEEFAYDEEYLLPEHVEAAYVEDPGAYMKRPSKHKHHKKKQWSNSNQWADRRRGRPNSSAKPRFRYPQYEDEQRQPNYSPRSSRRHKQPARLAVSTDPRSIKRAKKMIDNEWGRRKYRSFNEYGPHEERVDAAVEEDAPVRHHKREHASSHSWDSI